MCMCMCMCMSVVCCACVLKWLCVCVESVCGVVCVARLGMRKKPVCRFKTSPCVPAKRVHVLNMRAFRTYTRKRFEPTHGDVLNLHTGEREGGGGGSLSLSFSLLLSLSNNDNDHSSSRFSLKTHSSDLPECQSAWVMAHSLLVQHVRIMHETTVLVLLCKPRATWNEVGLYLCWKWVLCLVVFSRVSMW